MCKNNPWPKIFRNVYKSRISWSFIDSIEFFHPELAEPLKYNAMAFNSHFTKDTVIDLEQIDPARIKFNFNKTKLKKDVTEIVDQYLSIR